MGAILIPESFQRPMKLEMWCPWLRERIATQMMRKALVLVNYRFIGGILIEMVRLVPCSAKLIFNVTIPSRSRPT